MLQVLNGHMERVTPCIKLDDDGLEPPIAKLVNDIASVAQRQQGLVQTWVIGPRLGMWSNSYGRVMEIHVGDDSLQK